MSLFLEDSEDLSVGCDDDMRSVFQRCDHDHEGIISYKSRDNKYFKTGMTTEMMMKTQKLNKTTVPRNFIEY